MASVLDRPALPAMVFRPPPNWAAQLFDWLRRRVDREARLVTRYHQLVAAGARSSPGVLLEGYQASCAVVSPPTIDEPCWLVRVDMDKVIPVATEEIVALDACRTLDCFD